jgi:hypothetical protein
MTNVFGTVFSRDRKYRYALHREWDKNKPFVMFIGLNPSIADETDNDRTLNRCIRFAKSWDYGGLYMTNLFAFVTPYPDEMKATADPVGKENDGWLSRIAGEASIVIAAWGNDGVYLDRSSHVRSLLSNVHCLKLNKSGEPAHPLYLKATLKPQLLL